MTPRSPIDEEKAIARRFKTDEEYEKFSNNWVSDENGMGWPSLLGIYFQYQKLKKIRDIRIRKSARGLFNYINPQVECRCNDNYAVDVGVYEPCFACRKITELIAELNKIRW